MKRIIIILAALLFLSVCALKIMHPKIAEHTFQSFISNMTNTGQDIKLADGLHVFMCGTDISFSSPTHSGSCVGVLAGNHAFVFNAGVSGIRNLESMGFPINRIETVFLTHLDSNHIDGLGKQLMQIWVNGARSTPVAVRGPTGTSDVVYGFNAAYRLDSLRRTTQHGPDIANPTGYGGTPYEIIMTGKTKVVLDENDMKVTAFALSHAPTSPAYGYRVEYKGRSIALYGSTSYDPKIAVFAQGVDVLFHEALNKDMTGAILKATQENNDHRLTKTLSDITPYYATPVDAAKIAATADVKQLVLYHIVPTLPSKTMIPLFLKGTSTVYEGKITVAQNDLVVHLPAANDSITLRNSFLD